MLLVLLTLTALSLCPKNKLHDFESSLAVIAENKCQALKIGGKKLAQSQLAALSAVLVVNTALTELEMGNDHEKGFPWEHTNTEFLGEDGIAALVPALQQNRGIRTLKFGTNWFRTDMAGESIGRIMQANKAITKLSIYGNHFKDERAGAAISGIVSGILAGGESSRLEELHMQNNGIGDLGATAVVKLLNKNKNRLKVLGMGSNAIGDAGGVAIGSALQSNVGLTRLGLFRNKMSNTGVDALASGCEKHPTLQVLDVSGNPFGLPGAEAIAQMLHENTVLQELSTGRSEAGQQGLDVIAKAVTSGGSNSNSRLVAWDAVHELYHEHDRKAVRDWLDEKKARTAQTARPKPRAEL